MEQVLGHAWYSVSLDKLTKSYTLSFCMHVLCLVMATCEPGQQNKGKESWAGAFKPSGTRAGGKNRDRECKEAWGLGKRSNWKVGTHALSLFCFLYLTNMSLSLWPIYKNSIQTLLSHPPAASWNLSPETGDPGCDKHMGLSACVGRSIIHVRGV